MEQNPIITLPASVYPNLSDSQLIGLTRLGILAAYDCLVQRYRKAICLTAAAFVGPDAAQDVAQEAFVAAFHALAQLDDPARFGAWLRTIARHRAERLRKQNARFLPTDTPTLESALDRQSFLACDNLPEANCLRTERHREIARAIGQLTATHQEVILLHYLEDWPLSRIAAFLGISEDVVRGRLYRARTALRTFLDQERKNDCEPNKRHRHEKTPPTAGSDR